MFVINVLLVVVVMATFFAVASYVFDALGGWYTGDIGRYVRTFVAVLVIGCLVVAAGYAIYALLSPVILVIP